MCNFSCATNSDLRFLLELGPHDRACVRYASVYPYSYAPQTNRETRVHAPLLVAYHCARVSPPMYIAILPRKYLVRRPDLRLLYMEYDSGSSCRKCQLNASAPLLHILRLSTGLWTSMASQTEASSSSNNTRYSKLSSQKLGLAAAQKTAIEAVWQDWPKKPRAVTLPLHTRLAEPLVDITLLGVSAGFLAFAIGVKLYEGTFIHEHDPETLKVRPVKSAEYLLNASKYVGSRRAQSAYGCE